MEVFLCIVDYKRLIELNEWLSPDCAKQAGYVFSVYVSEVDVCIR